MSATAEQTPQLNYPLAEQVLRENVYSRVFFHKLAQDFGVTPPNPEAAQRLLKLADGLRTANQAGLSKNAQDYLGFLDRTEKRLGLPGAPATSNDEIKQAAALFVQDEDIRNAALVCQESVKQMLAG